MLSRTRFWLAAFCCLTFLPGLPAQAQETLPDSLREAVGKAERILVGVPESAVDLGGGKPFLIVVERALRGTGARGSRARLLTSPDAKQNTRLAENTRYAFLLVK
ncbi:MAG: hypothetical protein ACK50P_01325, partial [Planctomycetaceae bacterium]